MIVFDNDRELVRVEVIEELIPIANADRIELARVKGWHVIVPKGEYEVGDHAFFFEVDSMIPVDAIPEATSVTPIRELAYLADRGVTEEGPVRYHRVRTIKMRGVYSQGILVPVQGSSLSERLIEWNGAGILEVGGRSFATHIGVGKFVRQQHRVTGSSANILGPFPGHIQKTDSERVQNLSDEFLERVAGRYWVATEKIDGTSCTVWRDKEGGLHVASRNWERKDLEGCVYWEATRKYSIAGLLNPGEWIQFEIAGPGIQGNPLGLVDLRVFIFASSRAGVYLSSEVRPLWVPRLEAFGVFTDAPLPDRQALIERYDGVKSVVNPSRLAEGVVLQTTRAHPELNYRDTFKVISNRYLLKDHG